MVADALSRVAHMLAIQAVLVVQPQWIQEVLNSYTTDPHAQHLSHNFRSTTQMQMGIAFTKV